MSNFFENLMYRFEEDLNKETRKQIKLRYGEAIKKAELKSTKEIFKSLCDKYQNLILISLSDDLNDIIVDSFALIIRSQKDKTS